MGRESAPGSPSWSVAARASFTLGQEKRSSRRNNYLGAEKATKYRTTQKETGPGATIPNAHPHQQLMGSCSCDQLSANSPQKFYPAHGESLSLCPPSTRRPWAAKPRPELRPSEPTAGAAWHFQFQTYFFFVRKDQVSSNLGYFIYSSVTVSGI